MGSLAEDNAVLMQAVAANRLWRRLNVMSEVGETPEGGICRLALSDEDHQARRLLASWATARGFKVFVDAFGNFTVRREGEDPEAAPVVTGSHLDSQVSGGRYDGTYGVLAGFEVLEALEDAKIKTRRPIEVVSWMNEEGARFQPSCMGSGLFAGAHALGDFSETLGPGGEELTTTLQSFLDASDYAQRRDVYDAPATYMEAHIEQGPTLEQTGSIIGAVTWTPPTTADPQSLTELATLPGKQRRMHSLVSSMEVSTDYVPKAVDTGAG